MIYKLLIILFAIVAFLSISMAGIDMLSEIGTDFHKGMSYGG